MSIPSAISRALVLALPMCLTLSACGSSNVASTSSSTSSTDSSLPAQADRVDLFEYEPETPLDIQEAYVTDRDGVAVHDITFAGVEAGDRVVAFLVVPAGEGPFAGLLFMHWGGGSRSSFLDEAVALAGRGVVSLLVEARFIRNRDHFVDVVLNLRRGIDLLAARTDVDDDRLGFVGHSWGASFGAILADVDRRFETLILMAGVPSFSEFWNLEQMRPLDAVHYISAAAPASLFFQNAIRDENVTAEMSVQLFDAASDPKRIESYDTTHRFVSEEAMADRAKWLVAELGLS